MNQQALGSYWAAKQGLLTALMTIFAALPAWGEPYLAPNTTPLFSSYETIQVKLSAPLSQMFKGGKGTRVAGTIEAAGKTIPVEVRSRGQFTSVVCGFPKLMLKFKTQDIRGTIFEGNDKLDLGTHCDFKKESEFNVKDLMEAMNRNYRESILYRWAEIVGVPAFSTRPARFTYTDTSAEPVQFEGEHWAFFLEHVDMVVKRANGVEIAHKSKPRTHDDPNTRYVFTGPDNHPEIDWDSVARMAVFQALIGNQDCRMNDEEIHNHKLVRIPSGKWIAIPQDLNFAMLAHHNDLHHGEFRDLGLIPIRVPQERINQILKEFAGKKAELLATLKWLDHDPEAKKLFAESLEATLNEFASQAESN